ncbi:phage baseplate assembly protein V [Chitinophagaceae bacterium 26-R-25]|nr:phage baseplate assembly protein V [Chitinophagaceae bacterium 26-R-25]
MRAIGTSSFSKAEDQAHIGCLVYINNQKIENIQSIDITQTYGQPNQLEMRMFCDGIQDIASMYINGSEKLFGKTAHVMLLNVNHDNNDRQEQLFVITNVKLEQQGVLLLTGRSPDYLLKSEPHYEAFAETTLQQIAEYMYWPLQSISQSYMDCRPAYVREISFACCFNQHYYDFLQRYAAELGEWFFFNRSKLVFGQLPSYELSKLVYGVNCSHIEMEMEMQPLQSNLEDYDASANSRLLQKASADDGNIGYLNKKAFGQSAILYRNETTARPAAMGADNGAIEAMARARSRGIAAKMYTISGESTDWKLHIGKPAQLSFKIKGEEKLYNTVRIIEVKHHYKAGGQYTNSFKAIPATATVPPRVPYVAPQPFTVLATVVDNRDAEGRVKVDFKGWSHDNKMTHRLSNWMRVAANYAGQSDKVGTNRGFVFIPEVGEQVYVSFENGNPDRPYVSGSAFHGGNGRGGEAGNHIKSITTRSGVQQLINDADGSWQQQDASGSYIRMNGKRTMEINTDVLEINVRKLIINASQSTEITTNDYVLNALSRIYIMSKMLRQTISGFMHLFSSKALINSTNTLDIEAKETKLHGTEKALVHSDKQAVINSTGSAEIHGTNGTNHTNQGKDIMATGTEGIALAMVYFRPQAEWWGQFGFDWLREKDNGLTPETPAYEDIIKGGYKDGAEDLTPGEAYEKFKTEYQILPIARKGQHSAGASTEYFVPYLTLFSKEFVDQLTDATKSGHQAMSGQEEKKQYKSEPKCSATLDMLVEIEEDIDRLQFEYDHSLFAISTPILKDKAKTKGLVSSANATVTITCLKDLDGDREIKIYAYPKNKSHSPLLERKLAGKIIVLRNDATVRKTQKFVLVIVNTNIANASGKENTGEFKWAEQQRLKDALHQCLVMAALEDGPVLDLSRDAKFQIRTDAQGKKVYGEYMYKNEPKRSDRSENIDSGKEEIYNYVRDLYIQRNPQYASYFTIFCFGELNYRSYYYEDPVTHKEIGEAIAGQVQHIKTKNVFLFNALKGEDRLDKVMAHEGLHGLGLYHTHNDEAPITDPNRKYVFANGNADPERATDNFMSYGRRIKRSTWKWQWDIVRKNV